MADEEAQTDNKCRLTCKFIGFYWREIFLVIWPFICMIVFCLGFEPKYRCLFVVLVMAGYWVTECMPLYVTGMIPIVMMPLFNIQPTGQVCMNYLTGTNVMFLASLFIATSIEHSGLHIRIALYTIKGIGCSPRKLHFGLTLVTMLISMWLINSAATAMMCPIIHAVLSELEAQGIGNVYLPKDPVHPDDPPRPTKITMAYFLAAAYASTIGGIGTLVGTGTNLTYKGLYEKRFPDGDQVEFVSWLLYNFPGMILMTILTWLCLQIQLMGMFRTKSPEYEIIRQGAANQEMALGVIKQKLIELGPMSWHEIGVGINFLLIVFLWFFRKPQFIPGWGDLYPEKMVTDSTPAILVTILLIAIPASCSCVYFCSKDHGKRPKQRGQGLVTWKVIQTKIPWGLLFLLGGGFAVADAGTKSGMSDYLGKKLSVMKSLNKMLVLGITSFAASWATELTSNVAICSIIISVLNEMAPAMRVHPILFAYPAALNCSFAFLMPVGTPPNAIVADQANIKTVEMIKAGLPIKLLTWLIVLLTFPTYGQLFYPMFTTPDWIFSASNSTTPAD
ncbi:I'm not dead yet [Carabus blaptoides fortunei]